MKLINLCVLFSLLFCSIHAEDEIYVQLAGEIQLLPIYVSPVQNQESELPATYQQSIRNVLMFDLSHNGMTRPLSYKEITAKPSLYGQENFDAALDFSKLKQDEVLYLIKLKMKGPELVAKVVSVNGQVANTIDNIKLTGDLAKDRVRVHALADAIHKLLFGKSGIASCRILYTIKKQIAHENQEPRWISEVFEADYDGFNVQQITHDHSLTANPQYIPPTPGARASSFIYVSYKIGQPKIYSASLNGSTPKRTSTLRANQLTPTINKAANLVAFSSDITGQADLFLQELTGADAKPRQIFAAKGAANASPTFSPDGTKLAFVSNKDGSPKIYVMRIPPVGAQLKDVSVQLISKRCRENSAPSWSPDGKKLAFCAKTTGSRQIWIYDFETNQERELTQGAAIKENPSWAPDSLHLLFNATDASGTEIHLINCNQPEAVKITQGPGVKMFPAWEPKQL